MNLREHLLSRHCDPDKYAVQLDEENGVATFFLYNLSGQITGYQQYRPNAPKTQSNDEAKGKYYTFVSDTKKPAMFGVDIVPDEYGKNDIMIITEGLFDAVRFHAANLRAVATLTNDPKPLKNQLRLLPGLKIAVCDGGAAGAKLAKYADKAVFLPEGRDPGSLTTFEMQAVLNNVFALSLSATNEMKLKFRERNVT